MKPLVKFGLVIAGYIIAGVVASAVVAGHMAVTGDQNNPTNGGMNAFGDSLLFLMVFGAIAIFPTGAAFFFLRPYPAFWRGYSGVALAIAATSLAAFLAVVIDSRSTVASMAVLRMFLAPLFAVAFGLSTLFAPNRASRMALLLATVIEVAGFAGWIITLLLRRHG